MKIHTAFLYVSQGPKHEWCFRTHAMKGKQHGQNSLIRTEIGLQMPPELQQTGSGTCEGVLKYLSATFLSLNMITSPYVGDHMLSANTFPN